MLIKSYGVVLVHLEKVFEFLDICPTDFNNWLSYCHFPYMMVKHSLDTYMESEAFLRVLLKFAQKEGLYKWRCFTRRKNIMRTLSKSDKCEVAAEQGWRCARCMEQLGANFEVDHIIQFCITADDSKHNLQALHSHCHKEKTRDDLYLLNPHFGYASNKRLQSDEQNRIELQKAFQESQEEKKPNVFSNYFFEKSNSI